MRLWLWLNMGILCNDATLSGRSVESTKDWVDVLRGHDLKVAGLMCKSRSRGMITIRFFPSCFRILDNAWWVFKWFVMFLHAFSCVCMLRLFVHWMFLQDTDHTWTHNFPIWSCQDWYQYTRYKTFVGFWWFVRWEYPLLRHRSNCFRGFCSTHCIASIFHDAGWWLGRPSLCSVCAFGSTQFRSYKVRVRIWISEYLILMFFIS